MVPDRKRAVITGVSSGIGRAVARALLDDGWSVVGTYRRRYAAGAIKADPVLSHPNLLALRWDVADRSATHRMLRNGPSALAAPEPLALIHCAGTQEPVGSFEDTPHFVWEHGLATNLLGTARVVRTLLPSLLASDDPRIILLSGGGAFNPRPNFSAYAVSKAGVVALMETLAEELRGRVAVNCVAPGFVPTPIHAPVIAAGLPVPEGKGGELERAVACILHLLSDEARGLTGKTVSAVHDDWRGITAGRVPDLNRSSVWTRNRIAAREETTGFAAGRCLRCGNGTYNTHENGVACDGCGRRLAFARG